jgi:hypothetical protein
MSWRDDVDVRWVAMTMHIATLACTYTRWTISLEFGILRDTLHYFCFAPDLLLVSTTCKRSFFCSVKHGAGAMSCSLSRHGMRPRVKLLPFVFRDTLYALVHANMVGTTQKFRLSFVTNSCTVCNLSRRWGWMTKWKDGNPKLLCPATPLL